MDKVGAGDALFPILATCLRYKVPMDIALYLASISAAINSEIMQVNHLDKVYFKKIFRALIKIKILMKKEILIKNHLKLRQQTFNEFIRKGEAHLGGSFSMIEILIYILRLKKN